MSYSKETNKLIIWDFDGVISDTEKLWVNVWIEHMGEKYPHIENNNEQWFSLLSGISDYEKAGAVGAIKANMNIITYTEHLHVGKNDIISEVKKLGVTKVANNMQEVKNYISNQLFMKKNVKER